MSVVSENTAQATFCATLVDEWIRQGLTDVVVCPGSRSTPFALAFARRHELRLHVRLDERSAGFVALGLARECSAPVAILVTSGTAVSELHAAVCEADLSSVPLIVITADRPPELQGVGAPQTMNQQQIFGTSVRSFIDPGVAVPSAAHTWRALAARVYEHAEGMLLNAGPVQFNVPLRDPLDAPCGELPAPRTGPWRVARKSEGGVVDLLSTFAGRAKVLLVAGEGAPQGLLDVAAEKHWVLLGDPRSGLRREGKAVALADPILRNHADSLMPELVVMVGAPWASRVLGETIAMWASRGTTVVHLGVQATLHDPYAVVAERVIADSATLLASLSAAPRASDATYVDHWQRADLAARVALEEALCATTELTEPRIARILGQRTDLHVLVASSSMPIRELEWFAPVISPIVRSNRGVNGIDGVLSSAIGSALTGKTTACVIGDLAFLHDLSSLVEGLGPVSGSLTVVVVNNGGGGIFSFLPQADSVEADTFAALFHTARPVNHELLVGGLGHGVGVVRDVGAFEQALSEHLGAPGLFVIVAEVGSPATNVSLHDDLNQAIACSLRDVLN